MKPIVIVEKEIEELRSYTRRYLWIFAMREGVVRRDDTNDEADFWVEHAINYLRTLDKDRLKRLFQIV